MDDNSESQCGNFARQAPAQKSASTCPSLRSTSSDAEPSNTRSHDFALILIICVAQLTALGSLAQTIGPLPIILHTFSIVEPGKGSWLSAAYSLTAGTFILPAGRLGDIYGLKRMYIIGFTIFALSSLIAGFSVYGGFIMLSVCRGLQGIGAAIVVPNAVALIGTMYWHPTQETKRHACYALFGASAPVGFLIGALFATIFAQLSWWPWAFWIAAIFLVINIIVAYFVIPTDNFLNTQAKIAHKENAESRSSSNRTEGRFEEQSQPEKIAFDLWGSLTGVCGLILIGFAWNQAPNASWADPYIIVVLILGAALLIAFYFVEVYVALQPLVPFRNLSAKSILTLAVLAAGWGSFGIWLYYFFRLQQILRGYLPLTTVAQNAAVIPSGLAAAAGTGYLLSRVSTSIILLIATCCFLTGQILLATTPLHQSFWIQTFLSLIIMPFGMDMSFPSGTALVSAGMPTRYQGTASSLVTTVVNYSISLGLGFAGTITKNVGGPLTKSISGAGPPGLTGQAGLYPGGDKVKSYAYLQGYRASWYFAIGLDALGIMIAMAFITTDFWHGRNRKEESGTEHSSSRKNLEIADGD